MLLDIVRYPDERLRRTSEPVGVITGEIKEFCKNLAETMIVRDGVGLAAIQVGVPLRIFVLNDGGPKFFIDPVVTATTEETEEGLEGCLSLPGVFAKVSRPVAVDVTARDLFGTEFKVSYTGLMARASQHENDHLNGKLLIDYMSHLKKQMAVKKIKKFADRW